MKKRIIGVFLLAAVLLICGVVFYQSQKEEDGATLESREVLLDQAISQGKGTQWTIATETKLEDHIVSGAYSTDGKVTLAVFSPLGDGKYEFSSSVNREKDDIVIDTTAINGTRYNLIWFCGAQTEYAEATYIVNWELQPVKRFDTTNMDIICVKIDAAAKEYSSHVAYYDSQGNRYE